MRLDPEHVDVLRRATFTEGGKKGVRLDIPFMMTSLFRLTLWERGLLTEELLHAAAARRPTKAQRALLALFVHRDVRHEQAEGQP